MAEYATWVFKCLGLGAGGEGAIGWAAASEVNIYVSKYMDIFVERPTHKHRRRHHQKLKKR